MRIFQQRWETSVLLHLLIAYYCLLPLLIVWCSLPRCPPPAARKRAARKVIISGVVIGMILKFLTKTSSTPGLTKAGWLGLGLIF
ncbi:MAG: hypothetical protein K6U11_07965 [bacterium]|nr:hypothetical protein [bacterium]